MKREHSLHIKDHNFIIKFQLNAIKVKYHNEFSFEIESDHYKLRATCIKGLFRPPIRQKKKLLFTISSHCFIRIITQV